MENPADSQSHKSYTNTLAVMQERLRKLIKSTDIRLSLMTYIFVTV